MRGADERLQIDLARDLIFRGDLVFRQQGPATADYVTAAWHNFVYGDRQGGAVLLVRSVARARRALLQSLCAAGERVLLPANATHTLVESVKRAAVPFCFGGLDAHLHLLLPRPVRVAWVEPVAGLPTMWTAPVDYQVIDYADSLPVGSLPSDVGDVLLFGLHLGLAAEEAGALLVFRDATLAQQVCARLGPADEPEWERAAWQLQRLVYYGPRQQEALAQLQHALMVAAGLPLLPVDKAPALAHGVAVQVPPECVPSTFCHYVRSENTPIAWLPTLRPLHPAAAAMGMATATNLERWLLAPLGLTTTAAELAQTVLGVVKAAEYLGVRWYTAPRRAAAYAALLTARYGPGHDAYRPVFSTPLAAAFELSEFFADFAPLACRVGQSD